MKKPVVNELMNFRYDIEELRGVAVLFVVLFHKGLLRGGFIGVDIFFVISGYLITSIIQSKTEFDILLFNTFYKKRVVRILPLACCIIAAVIMLLKKMNILTEDYLSDAMLSLLLLFSFKRSIKKESYFDSIYVTPFLHFWSLNIEEQFYITFPILLIFTKNNMFIYLIILICSLYLYIYYVIEGVENSYYYFFCRLWEFVAGSIVYMKKNISKCNKKYKNIVMLLIILSSCVNKNCNRMFLPFIILGVAFYIDIDCKNNLLSNIFINYTGRISYSIYLVHYPLIILFSYNSIFFFLYLFCISILSYYLIEKQFNSLKYFYFVLILWIILILFIIYNYVVLKKIKRLIPYIKMEDINVKEQTNMWCSHCHYKDNNVMKALLVGDSHIEQWIPALYNILQKNRISIHHYYLVPNMVSNNMYMEYHFSFFKRNDKFTIIFVSFALRNRWLSDRRKFDQNYPSFVSFLLSLSNSIVVIDDTPLLRPLNLCQRCCKKKACRSCYGIIGYNISLLPSLPYYRDKRVIQLNLNNHFCKKNICYCQRGDKLVFEMWNHIFPFYIKTLSFEFNKLDFHGIKKESTDFGYNFSCKFYMHGVFRFRNC